MKILLPYENIIFSIPFLFVLVVYKTFAVTILNISITP